MLHNEHMSIGERQAFANGFAKGKASLQQEKITMGSFNFQSISGTLSSLTTALTSAGVTQTALPGLLRQIGMATQSNPNKSAELAICSQILQFSGNAAMVNKLSMMLATEAGIPNDAAALALTLTEPGVDVAARVMEIETAIRNA